MVDACYGKLTGVVRVIDQEKGQSCLRWENPLVLSWGHDLLVRVVRGEQVPVPGGQTVVVNARCQTGEQPVSGSYRMLGPGLQVQASVPLAVDGQAPIGWQFEVYNTAKEGTVQFDAYVMCLSVGRATTPPGGGGGSPSTP